MSKENFGLYKSDSVDNEGWCYQRGEHASEHSEKELEQQQTRRKGKHKGESVHGRARFGGHDSADWAIFNHILNSNIDYIQPMG